MEQYSIIEMREQTQCIKATARAIEHNDFLTAKIHDLLNFRNDDNESDYEGVNRYQYEQYDLHNRYSFFDQPFEENGLKGVKDVRGKVRVPALYKGFYQMYDYADVAHEALSYCPMCAYNQHDICALVSADGKGIPLTPFIYDAIRKNPYDSYFTTYRGNKQGLISAYGTVVVPCTMNFIYESLNGITSFEADGKFGLATEGVYIPPVYDALDVKRGRIYVRKGDVWGYLDELGTFIDEFDVDTWGNAYLLSLQSEF